MKYSSESYPNAGSQRTCCFTEWCTNVTHPSKRYEVRRDENAEASKPCKPKWNAIDAIGNKSNNEMHGGAAPDSSSERPEGDSPEHVPS